MGLSTSPKKRKNSKKAAKKVKAKIVESESAKESQCASAKAARHANKTGCSFGEAAKKFGVSTGSVSVYNVKLGFEQRPKGGTKKTAEQMKGKSVDAARFVLEGKGTYASAAKKFKCSSVAVYQSKVRLEAAGYKASKKKDKEPAEEAAPKKKLKKKKSKKAK